MLVLGVAVGRPLDGSGAMSHLWSFQSFSKERLDTLIADGPRCAAILKATIEARDSETKRAVDEAIIRYRQRTLLNRLLEFVRGQHRLPSMYRESFPKREEVLARIRRSGISYQGCNAEDAKTLDWLVQTLFSSDSPVLGELEAEMESPDGVHCSLVTEMIGRGEDSDNLVLLPILLEGRRLGSPRVDDCEYCVFTADEVRKIGAEIDHCFKANVPWSRPDMRDVANICLREVITTIAAKGKAAFCSLG
jgi:hypothetical protein